MPNVRIRIEKGTETAGDGQELQEKELKKQQDKRISIATMFAHQMIGQMESIFKTELGRVGDKTGDYIAQEGINSTLDVISSLGAIATGAATSISTMNPVPVIMAVVSVAVKTGQKYYGISEQQRHARYQREFLLERSGNATTNGSRGTEN